MNQHEKNFRRFEPTIEALLSAWPVARVLLPEEFNLAPISCVARLREALRSILSNPLWETKVNRSQLKDLRRKLCVALMEDGTVYLGPTLASAFKGNGTSGRPIATPNELTLITPPDNVITAATLLLHHRIVNKIVIQAPNTQARAQVSSLESLYDIAVLDEPTQLIIF